MVDLMWGIRLPRTPVCADHCTPFDAFADAYFARSPVSIWVGSRGFGGKSFTLATLVLTEAVLLGAESSVLGGSAAQSLRVQEINESTWYSSPMAPTWLLRQAPTKFDTFLTNGGHVRALMASSRSVRGPHPQRLRLDEIDEMELPILEAAQGQPMSVPGIPVQTTMSSTHQYPDGTVTEMLRRAREKGWPTYRWCFRETANPVDGWLTPEDIETKRAEVSSHMFAVEYELQEPSITGRAIDPGAVESTFDKAWFVDDQPGVLYELGRNLVPVSVEVGEDGEPVESNVVPLRSSGYVTGVDWAKESDWTVISTFDASVSPWRLVAWERTQRQPWPVMVQKVVDRVNKYPGILVHDATGIGNVLGDLLADVRLRFPVVDVVMAGRAREAIFSEYISGLEQGQFWMPRLQFLYDEHRYCRMLDLYSGYGPGGHPPDTFVSAALAWSVRHKRAGAPSPVVQITRASPWRIPSL